MKKIIFIFAGFLLLLNQMKSQTLPEQFNDLMSKNDTIAQLKFLEKWEQTDKNDPELYISYFNFYYNRSMKKIVRIEKTPRGKNSYPILDSLTKKPVGYMYNDIIINPEVIGKGLRYIDSGIEKFPSRLDMRFGKVYVFGEMKEYDNFTREIISAIDYSRVINNSWLWKDNKPPDEPMNFMLSNIQSYQVQLYNTGKDSLLWDMLLIAKEVLKYYPDNMESLSNLAIVYMLQKEYENAIEILLKAEKNAPNDYVIMSNLAQAYKLKGDKKNSIKYYEQVTRFGDNIAKQYARDQIKELEKNK